MTPGPAATACRTLGAFEYSATNTKRMQTIRRALRQMEYRLLGFVTDVKPNKPIRVITIDWT